MGGTIIDGTSALQFKGSFQKFVKALDRLSKLETRIDSLRIATVPLPEVVAIVIILKFSGPIGKFEEMTRELKVLKTKYGIETVPLPEVKPTGKLQAPEKRPKGLSWFVKIAS